MFGIRTSRSPLLPVAVILVLRRLLRNLIIRKTHDSRAGRLYLLPIETTLAFVSLFLHCSDHVFVLAVSLRAPATTPTGATPLR